MSSRSNWAAPTTSKTFRSKYNMQPRGCEYPMMVSSAYNIFVSFSFRPVAKSLNMYIKCGSGDSTYGFHQSCCVGQQSSSNKNTWSQSSNNSKHLFFATAIPTLVLNRNVASGHGVSDASSTTTIFALGVKRLICLNVSLNMCSRLCVVMPIPNIILASKFCPF